MRVAFTIFSVLILLTAKGQEKEVKNKALPDHIKLQYAGSIGFLSLGAGYETGNKKFEFDLYYGYVPESVGGVEIHTLTGKTTFLPFKESTNKTVTINPLTLGAYVAYTFGDQYFLFAPEKYPLSYYDYPTALHVGGFIGGRITKHAKKKQLFSRIGLYYEIGTTDKEFISYYHNREALKFTDILNIGIGIKGSFRTN